MACHFRIAARDTLIALPEVGLNVIPLSGTQRLPRLLPVPVALELILSGEKRRASDFAGTDLFDELIDSTSPQMLARLRMDSRSGPRRESSRSPRAGPPCPRFGRGRFAGRVGSAPRA